jgi:hypothetical protein
MRRPGVSENLEMADVEASLGQKIPKELRSPSVEMVVEVCPVETLLASPVVKRH